MYYYCSYKLKFGWTIKGYTVLKFEASGQLDSEALKDLVEEKAMVLKSSLSALNLELVEVKSSLAAKDSQIEILKKGNFEILFF